MAESGVILEEGLPLADLRKIVHSIRATAVEAGVEIVTGDTKVVEHGKCEGIYINTAGIGEIVTPRRLGAAEARPGDAVIVSGNLGEHGVAVLSRREGIAFQTSVVSDCAALWQLVKIALDAGAEIHAMRTRPVVAWPRRCATSLAHRVSGFDCRKRHCRLAARCVALAICWGWIR